jgi:hypothetical protein
MLLGAGSADAAQPKVERLLIINAYGQASNGYDWQLDASRSQPGGGSVSLQFTSDTGSASYVVRRPAEVSKHRLVADFGDLGEISARFSPKVKDHVHPGRGHCTHLSFGLGALKGRFLFEGEHGFTRVTSRRTDALVESISARHKCRDVVPLRERADDFSNGSILTSCSGDAGAGFFAVETAPEDETFFLATKTERSPQLSIVRTLELSGAARSFDVEGPKAARVVPPGPFTGRGKYRNGELAGRITAPLPGIGAVHFSPGEAQLQKLDAFEVPKCLPPQFGRRPAGTKLVTADASIADAVADFALSSRLRRILSR